MLVSGCVSLPRTALQLDVFPVVYCDPIGITLHAYQHQESLSLIEVNFALFSCLLHPVCSEIQRTMVGVATDSIHHRYSRHSHVSFRPQPNLHRSLMTTKALRISTSPSILTQRQASNSSQSHQLLITQLSTVLMLTVSKFLQIRTLPKQIELVTEPATFDR